MYTNRWAGESWHWGGSFGSVCLSDASFATISPRDAQMVFVLPRAFESPGTQGKLSFTAQLVVKTWELNHQTNQIAKCYDRAMCAAQSPPARGRGLGALTTSCQTLGQGSQCCGFSRDCLLCRSSSPRCSRLVSWLGLEEGLAAGPSLAGLSCSVCVFKGLCSRSAVVFLLRQQGRGKHQPSSVIRGAMLPVAALKKETPSKAQSGSSSCWYRQDDVQLAPQLGPRCFCSQPTPSYSQFLL